VRAACNLVSWRLQKSQSRKPKAGFELINEQIRRTALEKRLKERQVEAEFRREEEAARAAEAQAAASEDGNDAEAEDEENDEAEAAEDDDDDDGAAEDSEREAAAAPKRRSLAMSMRYVAQYPASSGSVGFHMLTCGRTQYWVHEVASGQAAQVSSHVQRCRRRR